LIIQCDHCHTRYTYAEERFEDKPSKKIRCAKCREVFEIRNPALEAAGGPGMPTMEQKIPPLKPGGKKDEQTLTGRRRSLDDSDGDIPDDTGSFNFSTVPSMPENQRLSLAITDGPDAAKVFRLEKPRVTIGRQNADILLNDREASRQHAALEVRDSRFFVQDLGSRNGTYVDGQKIDGEFEISDKGEFRVGATTLMLIVTQME
jgi:predicted Zn finger-like uncharacterized protein